MRGAVGRRQRQRADLARRRILHIRRQAQNHGLAIAQHPADGARGSPRGQRRVDALGNGADSADHFSCSMKKFDLTAPVGRLAGQNQQRRPALGRANPVSARW